MKWINIEDTLPPLGRSYLSGYVLVCCNDKEIRLGYRHGDEMKIACDYCSEDRFVTHWMPLPEPPKKDLND